QLLFVRNRGRLHMRRVTGRPMLHLRALGALRVLLASAQRAAGMAQPRRFATPRDWKQGGPMKQRAESTERTAVLAAGDELARTHDTGGLLSAMRRAVSAQGYSWLLESIRSTWCNEAKLPLRAGFYTPALVGHLRAIGSDDLADAAVALLSGGPPEIDPVIWL